MAPRSASRTRLFPTNTSSKNHAPKEQSKWPTRSHQDPDRNHNPKSRPRSRARHPWPSHPWQSRRRCQQDNPNPPSRVDREQRSPRSLSAASRKFIEGSLGSSGRFGLCRSRSPTSGFPQPWVSRADRWRVAHSNVSSSVKHVGGLAGGSRPPSRQRQKPAAARTLDEPTPAARSSLTLAPGLSPRPPHWSWLTVANVGMWPSFQMASYLERKSKEMSVRLARLDSRLDPALLRVGLARRRARALGQGMPQR